MKFAIFIIGLLAPDQPLDAPTPNIHSQLRLGNTVYDDAKSCIIETIRLNGDIEEQYDLSDFLEVINKKKKELKIDFEWLPEKYPKEVEIIRKKYKKLTDDGTLSVAEILKLREPFGEPVHELELVLFEMQYQKRILEEFYDAHSNQNKKFRVPIPRLACLPVSID